MKYTNICLETQIDKIKCFVVRIINHYKAFFMHTKVCNKCCQWQVLCIKKWGCKKTPLEKNRPDREV